MGVCFPHQSRAFVGLLPLRAHWTDCGTAIHAACRVELRVGPLAMAKAGGMPDNLGLHFVSRLEPLPTIRLEQQCLPGCCPAFPLVHLW